MLKRITLALLCCAAAWAQITPPALTQSTLTSNASAANVALTLSFPFPFVPTGTLPGMLYVDSEAMTVVSASLNLQQVTVQRGARGTTAATHYAGAVVFSGGPAQFVAVDKSGACDPNSPQLLNVTDQKYFTCTAGSWVSASTVPISGGGVPLGPAGGDLSGTYPNPGVARINGVSVPANIPCLGSDPLSRLVGGTCGINFVTQYAGGVTIGDGLAHTIATAPVGSVFNGITTLSALAAVTINNAQPFAWITAQSNPFAFSNDVYSLQVTNVGSGGTAGTFAFVATGGGCSVEPTGTFTVGKTISQYAGQIISMSLTTAGSGCLTSPSFDLTASGGLTGAVMTATVISDSTVTSLDIAWLAIQAGLQTGSLYIPRGNYIVGSVMALPLATPISQDSGGALSGTYLGIYGDGPRVSIILPGFDWGLGVALFNTGDPTGTRLNGRGPYGANYSGDMKGLGFFYNTTSFIYAVGTEPIHIDGINLGARLRTLDVEATGFFNNVVIANGSHTEHIRLHSNGGVYNMHWPYGSTFGDIHFHDLMIGGATKAAIRVAEDATVTGSWTGETYIGSVPYVFFGDNDAVTVRPIIGGIQFDMLMAEFTGNALIHDELGYDASTGLFSVAAMRRNASSMIIANLFMSYSNTYFWGGVGSRQRQAAVEVNAFSATVQNLLCDSGCWAPSSVATPAGSADPLATILVRLANDSIVGSSISGNINGWVTKSAAVPLLAGYAGPGSNIDLTQTGSWRGYIGTWANPTGGNRTVSKSGDLLQLATTGFNVEAGYTTASPFYPLTGVVRQSGVAVNAFVPIASNGGVSVNVGWISPSNGMYKMGTGIGAQMTIVAGSGGTPGSYSWVSTGGGCTTQPTGTFTDTAGVVTAYTITTQGVACTSAPSLSLVADVGLTGASLTPQWPSALGALAASYADQPLVGAFTGSASPGSGNNTVNMSLQGTFSRQF